MPQIVYEEMTGTGTGNLGAAFFLPIISSESDV